MTDTDRLAGLDVDRLARALRHIAFGGGSDAIDDDTPIDVGFMSYSGESSVRDLAAAIAREYAAAGGHVHVTPR